jgi:hypothetical protein
MDKVKLVPLQRLELEDTRALHDLPYEHMRRLVGALLGSGDVVSNAGGGLLSMPNFTYDPATGLFSLESFSYLELTKGGAGLIFGVSLGTPEARIVRFNSADATENINSPLDISNLSQNTMSYNVFVRWYRKDLDTQARRKWDTSLQNEVPFSPQTRERERVEFKVLLGGVGTPSESTSLDIGRWVKILSYTVTNNTLELKGYHALNNSKEIRDRFSNPALPNNEEILSINPTLEFYTNQNAISGFSSISTEKSKTIGISQVLTMIRGQLARILHTGTDDTNAYSYSSGDSWLNAPLMSLRGLRQEVTSIYAKIAGVESDLVTTNTNVTNNDNELNALRSETSKIYATATFTSFVIGNPNLQFEFIIHSESDITGGVGLHIDDTDAPIQTDIESLSAGERARVTSRLVFTFPNTMLNKTIRSVNLYFIQQGTYGLTSGVRGVLTTSGDFQQHSAAQQFGVPSFIRVLTDNSPIVSGDFSQLFKIRNENLNLVGSGAGDLSVTSTAPAVVLKVNDGFSAALSSQDFRYSINIVLEIDNN